MNHDTSQKRQRWMRLAWRCWRLKDEIQAAEMSVLCWVAGLSLRHRVRSSDIWRELRVELLFLGIKRSQLREFGHLVRMPPGRLPSRFSSHIQLGRHPRVDPKLAGGIMYVIWPGNASASPRRSWRGLLGWKMSWVPNWACCPPRPLFGLAEDYE